MKDVVVLGALRTPVGRRGGSLARYEAFELAATVIEALVPRELKPHIDRVVLANTTNAGNLARVSALAAGLPAAIPAFTVNAQCTGGLAAIRLGAEAIAAGAAGLVVAGGVESVSHSLVSLGAANEATATLPRVRHGAGPYGDPDMGEATDELAARLGITREAQDEYAATSYKRTLAAQATGFFRPLIVPCGEVTGDDQPRRALLRSRLSRYPSAFTPGGGCTVGNTAAPADGAAAVLLASDKTARQLGIEPLARLAASAAAATDPAEPPMGAIAAIERVLAESTVSASDIGRWEVNEAFAAKVLACTAAVPIPLDRLNVRGGAIAYGHPFAASGAILAVHLLAEMQLSRARMGLAALAGAGGLGEAAIFARG